jgi:hypothetical protein
VKSSGHLLSNIIAIFQAQNKYLHRIRCDVVKTVETLIYRTTRNVLEIEATYLMSTHSGGAFKVGDSLASVVSCEPRAEPLLAALAVAGA